jgi:hypothetical protein
MSYDFDFENDLETMLECMEIIKREDNQDQATIEAFEDNCETLFSNGEL